MYELERNLILLDGDYGDKREGCTTAGGVKEYGIAGIEEALVCGGSVLRLVGQLLWSGVRNNSSQVYMEVRA